MSALWLRQRAIAEKKATQIEDLEGKKGKDFVEEENNLISFSNR